jgi:hypothetical protein
MADARQEDLPYSLKYQLLQTIRESSGVEDINLLLCEMYANVRARTPEETAFFCDRDAFNFAREVLSDEALLIKVGPIVACHLLRYATGIIFEGGAPFSLISLYQKLSHSLTRSNAKAFDECFAVIAQDFDKVGIEILNGLGSLGPFSEAVNQSIVDKLIKKCSSKAIVFVLLNWEKSYPKTLNELLPIFIKANGVQHIDDEGLHSLCENKPDFPKGRVFVQEFVKYPVIREKLVALYRSNPPVDTPAEVQLFMEGPQEAFFKSLREIKGPLPPLSPGFLHALKPKSEDIKPLPFEIKIALLKTLGSSELWFTPEEWVGVMKGCKSFTNEQIKQLKSCHLSKEFWVFYLLSLTKVQDLNRVLHGTPSFCYHLFHHVVSHGKVDTLKSDSLMLINFSRIGEWAFTALARGTSTLHMRETMKFQAMIALFSPFNWAEELEQQIKAYKLKSDIAAYATNDKADSNSVYTEEFLQSMLEMKGVKTKNQAKFLMHCFVQDNRCVADLDLSQGIAQGVSDVSDEDFEAGAVSRASLTGVAGSGMQGADQAVLNGQKRKWAAFGVLVARQCIVANASIEGTLPYEKGLLFDPRFVRVLAKQFAFMGLNAGDHRATVIHAFSQALIKTLYEACDTQDQVEALQEMLVGYRREKEVSSLFFEASHKTEVTKAMMTKVIENAGFKAFLSAHSEVGIVRALANQRNVAVRDEALHRMSRESEAPKVVQFASSEEEPSIFGADGGDEASNVQEDAVAAPVPSPVPAERRESTASSDGIGGASSAGAEKRRTGMFASWRQAPVKLPRTDIQAKAYRQQQQAREGRSIAADNVQLLVAPYNARLEEYLHQITSAAFTGEDSIALCAFLESGDYSQLDLNHFRESIFENEEFLGLVGPSVVSLLLEAQEISRVSQCYEMNRLCQEEYTLDAHVFECVGEYPLMQTCHLLLRHGKIDVFCRLLAETSVFDERIAVLRTLDQHTKFLTREVIEKIVAFGVFRDVEIETLTPSVCEIENTAAWFLYTIFQDQEWVQKFTRYFSIKENQEKYFQPEDPKFWPLALKWHEQMIMQDPNNQVAILAVLRIYAEHEEVVSLECLEVMRPSVEILREYCHPNSTLEFLTTHIPQQCFLMQHLSKFSVWDISIESFVEMILKFPQSAFFSCSFEFPRDPIAVSLMRDGFLSALEKSGQRVDFTVWKEVIKSCVAHDRFLEAIQIQQGLVQHNLASPIELWNFFVEEIGLRDFSGSFESEYLYGLYNSARAMAVFLDAPRSQESLVTFAWMDMTAFLMAGFAFFNAYKGLGLGYTRIDDKYLIRALNRHETMSVLWYPQFNVYTEEFCSRLFSVKTLFARGLANVLALICLINPPQLLCSPDGHLFSGNQRWGRLGDLFAEHAIFRGSNSIRDCGHSLLLDFMGVMLNSIPTAELTPDKIINIQAFHKGVVTHLLSRCTTSEEVKYILPYLVSYRRRYPKLYEDDHNSKVIVTGVKALFPRKGETAPAEKPGFFTLQRLTEKLQSVKEARRAEDGLYNLAAARLQELHIDEKTARAMLVSAIEAGNSMSVVEQSDGGVVSDPDLDYVPDGADGAGGLAGGGMFAGGDGASGGGVDATQLSP